MTLSARGLVFRYPGFALRVERLEIGPARLTAVVGPNGAGKTTLLKCLSGLLPAGPGAVSLDGKDLASLGESRRARLLAYVPQEHTPAFGFTVLDVVLMGRAAHVPLFSPPSTADEALAREALAYVGLTADAGRPYVRLSSGERRLVLIARALAQSAGILVLDEPTTFLDPRHEAEVMSLARRLAAEEGKAVLMTLHNLDLAARYADVLVVLKGGEVVASGPPGEVLSEGLLESVYGLPMRLVPFEGRTLVVS